VRRYGFLGDLMRFIIVAAALLFSSFSFSADYYWRLPTGHTGGSPSAACGAYVSSLTPRQGFNPSLTNVVMSSQTMGECVIKDVGNISVGRNGDSCPNSQTYDPSKYSCTFPAASDGEWCIHPSAPQAGPVFIISGGVCVAPVEATKKAQCKAYSKDPVTKNPVVTTWRYPTNSSAEARNPQKASDAIGCELQLTTDVECKTFPAEISKTQFNPDGSPYTTEKTLRCKTNATLTGEVAKNQTGSPTGTKCGNGDAECVIEPPKELKEEKPCTYQYDIEGRKTCTSWNFKGKEGAEKCGHINGQFVCKNDVPKAVGKGLSIATTISEKSNADGTKTVEKTDVAKQTTCVGSGPGACQTLITTNKSTTINGADGKPISTTGSCSGASCATDKNPDGNGDGLGDCTGDKCDDGEGSQGGITKPEFAKQDNYGEATQKFYNRVKTSPLIGGLSAIQIPTGGTCNIGSAKTFFGSIDLNSFCVIAPTILQPLRYLFLAIWAWAAIRLFFTA
jgi:hypothetical protein